MGASYRERNKAAASDSTPKNNRHILGAPFITKAKIFHHLKMGYLSTSFKGRRGMHETLGFGGGRKKTQYNIYNLISIVTH